jgi:hypothetical protein
MKRVKIILFVMSVLSFGLVFSIMTHTSEQNSYATSSNFTKFTSKDVVTAKEKKLVNLSWKFKMLAQVIHTLYSFKFLEIVTKSVNLGIVNTNLE